MSDTDKTPPFWWGGISLEEALRSRTALKEMKDAIAAGVVAVDAEAFARALALQQLLFDETAVEDALTFALGLVDGSRAELERSRDWHLVAAKAMAAAAVTRAIEMSVEALGPKLQREEWRPGLNTIYLATGFLTSAKNELGIEALRQRAAGNSFKL
ncbi:MAG TPA: hypothetical protein VLA61_12890 [Ideonella sp.]|uniref:hypothetical protein n=1 Tax=Ideonella sp. TaxID=1929293 RepID=UPI002C3ED7B4|nr:hypothetical protein [Ideonella sp.]HSI49161.1 hypothetical protein [Ideonella sp.]